MLKRIIHKLKKDVFNSYHYVKHSDIKWIGNQYGGFYLDTTLINQNSTVFSVGIGEDISFDKGLNAIGIKKVHMFDPTPKSISYIKSLGHQDWIDFKGVGVSIKDQVARFYMPKNTNHVSGSVFIHANTTDADFIDVNLKSINTLMNDLGLTKLDVLKMDIEGSEYEVLLNLMKENIFPKQICVEFHNRYFTNGEVLFNDTIISLKKNGYEIYGVSKTGEEYLFVKTS